jgi:hypothetical protein
MIVRLVVAMACALMASAAQAQINMPDPSQIHGRAIPAPELATGTVTVRVVREALGNNLQGQTVRVTTGSASRTATTDAQGRAEFPNLVGGVEGRAEVTVDGETLVSEPFNVPTSGGLRVILVAGLAQAAAKRTQEEAAAAAAPPVKGTVALGPGTRILMEFRDDNLQVFYMLDVVNNARNRVDIGGPLIIDLPTGAAGAATLEGSAPATVSGDRVTIQGPFNSGSTQVQVGFALRYTEPDVTIEQTWPVAAQQTTVAIERVGAVGLASPQFANVGEVRAEDGTPYYLGTGPAVAAGGTLVVQLTNLPVHSAVPQYVGLALAAAVLAFGGWLAFSGRSRTDDVRRRLIHRRDTLLGELAQLEDRRRAGTLDARHAARQQKMLAELEQIYGELDEASAGPQGGGEGLAA